MKEDFPSTGKRRRSKRLYFKPRLRTIKLHAEEVLGTGCKTTVSQGPGSVPVCISGCFQSGS